MVTPMTLTLVAVQDLVLSCRIRMSLVSKPLERNIGQLTQFQSATYRAEVVVIIACILEGKLLPGHLLYIAVFFDLAGLLISTVWLSLKEVERKKKAVAEHQSTATKKNHSYHVSWGEKC